VDELPEGLDAGDGARDHVLAIKHGAMNLANRLPRGPGEIPEQRPVVAEEDPEPLRDGENLSACGTHRQASWRWATGAQTSSATCMAMSRVRFWWQLGHKHRLRHENATNISC